MNLANKLTLSRVVVIPLFLVAVLPDSFWIPAAFHPFCRVTALLIFIGAAITDYYDGVLARRNAWISDFGKIVDPLADKLIVLVAMVAMVELPADTPPNGRAQAVFPAWMVSLILCRELLITGLRTLASNQGRVLAADRWGKNKTIAQMTAIITGLVYLAARDILTATGHWQPYVDKLGIDWWLVMTLKTMLFICVVVTVYSGYNYLRANMDVIRESLK